MIKDRTSGLDALPIELVSELARSCLKSRLDLSCSIGSLQFRRPERQP